MQIENAVTESTVFYLSSVKPVAEGSRGLWLKEEELLSEHIKHPE